MEVLQAVEFEMTPTRPYSAAESASQELQNQFESLIRSPQVSWQMSYRLLKPLGAGGQGVVFLADRINPHDLSFRLALKFYRPDVYADVESYQQDMARIARVAMKLARPQQDHLLDVFNVVVSDGVQVVPMEWVDGIDLAHLLRPHLLEMVREQVDDVRWAHVNDVIVTQAKSQLRLQPGAASAILRDCLAGLASLHREGIVHADIKPANVMIKRTGTCKLIDFGSSFHVDDLPQRPTWTPRYAAVEVLQGDIPSAVSDLASLGYVFVEMLSGEYPFAAARSPDDLIAAKRRLPDELVKLLPKGVAENKRLLSLIRRLIDPEPTNRFPSAEAADLGPDGAAEFQKQLVKGNLSSEYANDIRLLLEELE
ncbi:MAG: serine/threonine protein kinase [Planctomycetaceae bacterium]|nr:serine/threonine protein kinase [Planctomycetaceae bacterium]